MARHNRDRFRRDESNWGYGRREDEGRGMWDRTRDEIRSWGGDEEAERRRNQDEMRGQRNDWRRGGYGRQEYEQNWGRNYGSDYGSGAGRSGQNRSENTWNAGNAGNRGWNRDESEDWRHLDNYWNDMYGESYPGRAEFSGRQYSERDYRPTFGGENFGGLGGPTNWMGTNRNFSGRGPRNYKRSDERIQEDINEQLTRHPMIDATEIEVTCQDGECTLRGTVEHREAKRMAEDVAEGVSGVKNVRNEIRVQRTGNREDRAA